VLRDFIRERRVVTFDGLRFTVHKPTVETACLFMLCFTGVAVGCRLAWKENREGAQDDALRSLLPHFTAGDTDFERVSLVLESCVDGPDLRATLSGLPRGKALELVHELVGALLKMTDVDRMCGFLGLDAILDRADKPAADEDSIDEKTPGKLEVVVCGLASHFSIDPAAVMRWPAELLIAVSEEVLPYLNPGPPDPMILGKSRKEWAKLGVTLSDDVVH
jgi:hypothetical protein